MALLAEAPGGMEDGLAIIASIHVPADQGLAAGGGVPVAARGPHHPAAAVLVREEGEELLAVGGAVPADRAVAVGGEGEAAVRGLQTWRSER